MKETKKKKPLQWHPGFFAGLQIELDAEADNLEFENEHLLGTKPKQIDVLIIKKDTTKPIRKTSEKSSAGITLLNIKGRKIISVSMTFTKFTVILVFTRRMPPT